MQDCMVVLLPEELDYMGKHQEEQLFKMMYFTLDSRCNGSESTLPLPYPPPSSG